MKLTCFEDFGPKVSDDFPTAVIVDLVTKLVLLRSVLSLNAPSCLCSYCGSIFVVARSCYPLSSPYPLLFLPARLLSLSPIDVATGNIAIATGSGPRVQIAL